MVLLSVGKHTALIVVDVQLDFCPGGALPVRDGDKVVPVLNDYLRLFESCKAPIYATRDWHPTNHMSFKDFDGIWPAHCVQNTPGANFHPDLKLPATVEIISKATRPDQEAYSGFQGTDFAQRLRARGVRELLVGGLATDYCVKNTALDAVKEGYEVFLLEDASRGVDVGPGDSLRAIEEMRSAGVKPIKLHHVVAKPEVPA